MIGIFGPVGFHFFLHLTGFFPLIIFPTATAATSEGLSNTADMSFGLFSAFDGLGCMIGSWAVGTIADMAGIPIGFALLIFMAFNITAMSSFHIIGRKKAKLLKANGAKLIIPKKLLQEVLLNIYSHKPTISL